MPDESVPFEFEPTDWEFSAADRFFGVGPDWRSHAVMFTTSSKGAPYDYEFSEAADALVAHQLAKTSNPAGLLFPILFLYRHAIELKLKTVIYVGLNAPTVVGTHNLVALWDMARPSIDALGERSGMGDHVGRIIGELAAVDSNSEAFRFDRDRKGQDRPFPEELMRVDLRNVQRIARKVVAYLDGAIDMIHDLNQHRDYYE